MSNYAPTPLHGATREASAIASSGTIATSKVAPTVGTSDNARLKEAAVQFEAVFVRQMLASLEKATSSPMGKQSSGGSIYGSMVVSTVADAIAQAGGLGLGSMIMKSLSAQGSQDVTLNGDRKLAIPDSGLGESSGATGKATPESLAGTQRASLATTERPP